MTIDKLGIQNKEATIILGAGATRGASCFENTWMDAPLDADFFNQVQKLSALDHSHVLRDLLTFAREEFGEDLNISMEKFFTQIESLDTFHETLTIARGPRVKRYAKTLDQFTTALATVFQLLGQNENPAGTHCKYHEALVSKLYSGDTILSFNYDCVIDFALKAKAGKRWDAQHGYGHPVANGFEHWHDHNGKGRISQTPIKLLKMHGSLNWDRNHGNDLHLRELPYETANRSRQEVVPPVWNKRVSGDPILSDVWKESRKALRRGPVLIVVGYSVPDTDLLSQSLLRVETADRKLSHLIVVNRDQTASQKLIKLLDRAVNPKTAIFEIPTLKDLGAIIE